MKKSKAAVPPPPEQSDPFEEGALWALSQVLAVVNDQRDGAFLIERMLKDAPEEKKQVLTDILRPLSAQQSTAETIYNRVEQRVGRHLRERYRAARKAEAMP
jgi:hypothetical protein